MAEPNEVPHFTQLDELRLRLLELHGRRTSEQTVESALAALVDGLEETLSRARLEGHLSEYPVAGYMSATPRTPSTYPNGGYRRRHPLS